MKSIIQSIWYTGELKEIYVSGAEKKTGNETFFMIPSAFIHVEAENELICFNAVCSHIIFFTMEMHFKGNFFFL